MQIVWQPKAIKQLKKLGNQQANASYKQSKLWLTTQI